MLELKQNHNQLSKRFGWSFDQVEAEAGGTEWQVCFLLDADLQVRISSPGAGSTRGAAIDVHGAADSHAAAAMVRDWLDLDEGDINWLSPSVIRSLAANEAPLSEP